MNSTDCINFANDNKISFFATIDNGRPHVRAMFFWFADQSGYYFQTMKSKSIYNQLQNNPWAEVCFYKHGDNMGTMLRINGEVEFIDDMKLKEKTIEDRTFLKKAGITPENPELIIFKISHGQAHFWNAEISKYPKEVIHF